MGVFNHDSYRLTRLNDPLPFGIEFVFLIVGRLNASAVEHNDIIDEGAVQKPPIVSDVSDRTRNRSRAGRQGIRRNDDHTERTDLTFGTSDLIGLN